MGGGNGQEARAAGGYGQGDDDGGHGQGDDNGALHQALSRYTQATMVQIAQNVVCNSTHDTAQRAARPGQQGCQLGRVQLQLHGYRSGR